MDKKSDQKSTDISKSINTKHQINQIKKITFLTDYCPLCESNLEIHHFPMPESQQISEQGHCVSCNIKVRDEVFCVH